MLMTVTAAQRSDVSDPNNIRDLEVADESRTTAAKIRRSEVHQNYLVPVLSKAIKIIRLLENNDKPLKVDEIARQTGVSHSTTYRILRTLSAHNYMPEGSAGVYCFKQRRSSE
jgi:AraC-like DNA-binding protein